MAYSFSPTSSGTIEVFQDGQRISTTTAANAASTYGYSATPTTSTQQAITNVGTAFSQPAPTGLTPQQQAAYQGVQAAFAPAPTPTPIAVQSVQTPQTPLPVTTPTPTNPYPVAGLTEPDFSVSPAQQPASDLNKRIQGLNYQTVGKTAYQAEQERLAGVPGYEATIRDLGAQLTAIKNEAAAIPLQLQQGAADRGVTTPLLAAQENSRLRTNAIAALGVSTLLAAAQGQLANAQAMADKAVEQKYGPIEEEIKASMANLQLILNSPEYTNDDKRRAFQMQQTLQARSEAIAQQKTDYANVLKIGTEAASNIANFTPTAQYQSAAQALQAISEAASPQAALQIAASVGLTSGGTAGSSTSDITEYNLAKQQGYTGTFQQWLDRRGSGTTVFAQQQAAAQAASTELLAARGSDGYTDPNLYARLRASSALSATEFDNKFGYLVNPLSRERLGLGSPTTAQKNLTPDQQSIINDAKAALDYAKQLYQDVPAVRANIIQQSIQQYGFDPSPYI